MRKTKPRTEKVSENGGTGKFRRRQSKSRKFIHKKEKQLEDVKTSKMMYLTWFCRDIPSYSPTL